MLTVATSSVPCASVVRDTRQSQRTPASPRSRALPPRPRPHKVACVSGSPESGPAAAGRSEGRREAVQRRALLAGSAAAVGALLSPLAHAEASVFTGAYRDSNHPGCPRSIDERGVLRGLDPDPFVPGQGFGRKEGEPGTCSSNGTISGGSGKPTVPWEIKTKINEEAKTIFIDFDQKDGSGESFTCEWTGTGIRLPDGKEWTKLP